MLTELYLNRTQDVNNVLKSKFYHKIDVVLLQSSQIAAFPDKDKKLAVLIDYPYGLSNTTIREHEIIYSIRSGAKFIDLPINLSRPEDLYSCREICKVNHVQLRPILEYRSLSTSEITEACERLNNKKIDTIILGTGSIVDDIDDNIIICSHILKNTNITPIPTVSNINHKNLQILSSIGIKTIRFMSLPMLENIYSNS
jgi:deoxyribose-phosphate aldolase